MIRYLHLLTIVLVALKLTETIDITWFTAVFPSILSIVLTTIIVLFAVFLEIKVNKRF